MTDGNRIWVVFSDRADWWCLKLLKPGFRHCFAILEHDGGAIAYDPMLHRTDLVPLSSLHGRDVAAWFAQQGMRVLSVSPRQTPRRLAPIRPYNCVEAVKRLLGLHEHFVFTPWQLYLKLQKYNNTQQKSVDIE